MIRPLQLQCAAATMTLLVGCSFAPRLQTPQVPTAKTYKETGSWTQGAAGRPAAPQQLVGGL